jgi:hypothetical protein
MMLGDSEADDKISASGTATVPPGDEVVMAKVLFDGR